MYLLLQTFSVSLMNQTDMSAVVNTNTKQQQRVVNNRFTRYFFTFVRLFLPVDRLGNRDDDIK